MTALLASPDGWQITECAIAGASTVAAWFLGRRTGRVEAETALYHAGVAVGKSIAEEAEKDRRRGYRLGANESEPAPLPGEMVGTTRIYDDVVYVLPTGAVIKAPPAGVTHLTSSELVTLTDSLDPEVKAAAAAELHAREARAEHPAGGPQ